jgi:subtilisin family serine protease
VAFKAKVMAVKHAHTSGEAVSTAAAQALLYAVANGADVINNSWGLLNTVPAVVDAVKFAHALGVVVVFAAGNDSRFLDQSGLLAMRETIKVAATAPDDSRASFSNWGKFIDVAAPGGGSPGVQGPVPVITLDDSILSLRADAVPRSELSVGDPVPVHGKPLKGLERVCDDLCLAGGDIL